MPRPLFLIVLLVGVLSSAVVGIQWRSLSPALITLLLCVAAILTVIAASQRELLRFWVERRRWPHEDEAEPWNQELHGRRAKAKLIASAAAELKVAQRTYTQRVDRAVEQLNAARRTYLGEKDRTRKALSAAQASHQRRATEASTVLASWRDPGQGSFILSFKAMTLRDHAFIYKGRALPLAHAQASVVGAKLTVFADGRQEAVKFGPKEMTQALHFATRLSSAVAAETLFEQQRPAAIASAAERLARLTADTAAIDAARAAVAAADANQDLLSAIEAAEAELAAARAATAETQSAHDEYVQARERAVEPVLNAPEASWLPRPSNALLPVLSVVVIALIAGALPSLSRWGVESERASILAQEARVAANAQAQLQEREVRAQATAAASAGKAALEQQARGEAVELLGQAIYKREEGQFGIAIELARQAQAKAPDYADANLFFGEVTAQATAAALQAQVAATAQARAASEAAAQAAAQATTQAQAAASSTARANAARFIPGLTMDAVKRQLEPLGMRCNVIPYRVGVGFSGLCQDAASRVPVRATDYSGDTLTQVEDIGATIGSCPTALGAAAGEFLGAVASLPYSGGNPAAARQWVVQQLAGAPDRPGIHAQTAIGGAKFEMYGPACSRGLSIFGLNSVR